MSAFRFAALPDRCVRPLTEGWELAVVAPSAAADPSAVAEVALSWLAAPVPGTVGSAFRAAGKLDLGQPPCRFDGTVFWYRLRFAAPDDASGANPSLRQELVCEGLATVAEVWLNGTSLGRSDNMFRAYRWDVSGLLQPENELLVRFEALDKVLGARRPRPRWRVPMIEHQQLRYVRTTLLGRTPGWSPPVPAVGPWRAVTLEEVGAGSDQVKDVVVRAEVEPEPGPSAEAGQAGATGILTVGLSWTPPQGRAVAALTLVVVRGTQSFSSPLAQVSADRFEGQVRIPDVALWWPCTHGTPALYELGFKATLREEPGELRANGPRVGFRTVRAETADSGFSLAINGSEIFARGACWTPPDPVAMQSSPEALRVALTQMVDAGLNMVRVGGTMVYESDAFYDLCDELGLMVWQDFMFANMDYPEQDPAFLESTQIEVRQFLARMQGRPCLAVLCGDSEGEQQAAMWGAPRETWARPFFRETLRTWAAASRPDVPYWPSSASGGAFPHQPSQGTASYYGVGAYLRPLDDARVSGVRFASECLAFANVPETSTLEAWGGGQVPRVHTPTWKARTPRDLGAGWDFDDVRDHYVGRLFGIDPGTLRYADHERYLELGRVAVGEVMAATFGAWRRTDAVCRGGLVWFLRDLWVGAGWGLVDAHGLPKAAYHFVRRACAPLAVVLSDEGLNGFRVDLVNDGPAAFVGELRIDLFRAGELRVGGGTRNVKLPPRASRALNVVELLEGFQDLSFAYRFGPPGFDLVVASLVDGQGKLRSQSFGFPTGRPVLRERDLGLTAKGVVLDDGLDGGHDEAHYALSIESRRFAYAVVVEGAEVDADDQYFSVLPGLPRKVTLRRRGGAASAAASPPRLSVRALNAEVAARVVWS